MIKLLNFLYFSLLAISTSTPVALASSSLTDTQVQNIAQVQTGCAERDWSKVQCSLGEASSSNNPYRQSIFSPVDAGVDKATGWIPQVFDLLNRSRHNQGEAVYAQLIEILRQTQAKYKLSDCQSACLATCATSHYATYTYEQYSGTTMQRPAFW